MDQSSYTKVPPEQPGMSNVSNPSANTGNNMNNMNNTNNAGYNTGHQNQGHQNQGYNNESKQNENYAAGAGYSGNQQGHQHGYSDVEKGQIAKEQTEDEIIDSDMNEHEVLSRYHTMNRALLRSNVRPPFRGDGNNAGYGGGYGGNNNNGRMNMNDTNIYWSVRYAFQGDCLIKHLYSTLYTIILLVREIDSHILCSIPFSLTPGLLFLVSCYLRSLFSFSLFSPTSLLSLLASLPL
jgi:hypothetical protein